MIGFPTCPTCGGSGHFDPSNTTDDRDYGRACPSCVEGVVITDELRERVAQAVAAQYSMRREPWYAETPGEYIARMRLESAAIVDAALAAVATHLKEKGTEQ